MSIGRYVSLRFFLLLLAIPFVSPGVVSADAEATTDPVAQCTVLLELHQASVEAEKAAQASADPGPDKFQDQDQNQDAPSIAQQPIADICPVQVAQLQQHRFAELLARPTSELMLLDLERFYRGVDALANPPTHRPTHFTLDKALLLQVLDELGAPPEEPVSLWQRVLRWLDQWFSDSQEEQDWDWWENLVPSEATMTVIFYLSVALVLLLALGIIFVEVRAAYGHRRKGQRTRWHETAAQQAQAMSLEAVAQAPLREQPGLLLQWLLSQLESRGVLQVRKSLTHRDIAAASVALAQTDTVSQLCHSAERATFGGWTPTRQEMDVLVAAGHEAMKSLQADAPEPGA